MLCNRVLIVFTLILGLSKVFSQACLPEGITFSTQQEIDNFPANFPDCTEIEGFVRIQESTPGAIDNLFGLIQIARIEGDLTIVQNKSLEELSGLNNLQHVEGSVWISQNPALTDLQGLNNLIDIGGFFQVSFCDGLFSLNGIENLSTVGTSFSIQFNEGLVNLNGIKSLDSVGTFFTIQQNPSLSAIDFFDDLTSVGDFFTLQFNEELLTLNGFPKLSMVGGFMSIQHNPKLTDINAFPVLQRIGGFLSVQYNDLLEDLYGFNKLEQTGSFITIQENPNLGYIEGFHEITYIGGFLRFRKSILTEIKGFNKLHRIDGSLIVDNCDELTVLVNANMPLDSLNGNIVVTNNALLDDLSGIRSVDTSTIAEVIITNNPNLSECDVKSLCDFVDPADNSVKLEGNKEGCNSREEIQDKCVLHPGCTFLSSPVDGQTNVLVNTLLSWWSVPDADGYSLSIGLEPGLFDLIYFMDIGADTSYMLPFNLPCQSEVFVLIEPYNEEGLAFNCEVERFSTEVLADAGTNVSICEGTDTQLQATGGTMVEWNPVTGLDNPFIPDPVASPKATTWYFATVSNGNPCFAVDSVLVTVLDAPNPNPISTPETGKDFKNGTAGCYPDGGLPPYQIEWSTGDTTKTLDSLVPGTYFVSVTDANLCIGVDSVVVEPYECPEIMPFFSLSNISCYGSCDGMIHISNIVNGQPPFSFSWSNGDTINLLENLCPGNYILTLTDVKNCEVINTYTIIEPAMLSTSISSTDESGNEFNDGKAEASPEGGTPPYSYLWSNGEDTRIIDNLEPGIYYLSITDDNDCRIEDSVTIGIYLCPEITLDPDIERVSCYGLCDGSLSISIAGGTEPYFYYWNEGNAGSVYPNLCAGNYYLTVTDTKNCSISDSFAIEQPEEIFFWVEEVVDVRVGLPGSIDLSVDNELAYTYSWTGPNGFTSDDLDIDSLEIGCYTLVITQLETGCTRDTTICVHDLTNLLLHEAREELVVVYPNPAKDRITILLNSSFNPKARLQITDLNGKIHMAEALTQKKSTLALDNMKDGVYLIQIQQGNNSYYRRLILLR